MNQGQYLPSALDVKMCGDERSLCIIVRGELDVATAPLLREQLHASAERGAEETVLDASGLDFVDSSGIGLLVAAKRRASAEGNAFIVAAPSASVIMVIEMMGLAEYLGL